MSRSAVMEAFGQAEGYLHHAEVQRQVAQTLADRLPPLVPHPLILELGCGTGFLTQRLLARFPDGRLICSDLAQPMVKRCQAQLGHRANMVYVVLDGEEPAAIAPGLDLIAASMVFQWFVKPLETLGKLHDLLSPGGCLAFATLGPATFSEWRAGCLALEMAHGLPSYPTGAAWQQAWPTPTKAHLREEKITRHYPSGLAFLRSLRAVGAHQPALGYHPQPAGHLRRLLRHLEQKEGGVTMTYQVFYGVFYP